VLVAKPPPPVGAAGGRLAMKFDDWLFWAAFLGFLGCNAGLLVWALLG